MWLSKIKSPKFYCGLNGAKGHKVEKPYVNLYVKITKQCNALCPFCIFKGKDHKPFNFAKFEQILLTLANKFEIRKIAFTGGEPSTKIVLLKDCLALTKSISSSIFTVTNSNGFMLKDLVALKDLDNISLSRHHYEDTLHTSIMGTIDVATSKQLKQLNVSKIHLSCNLIKGFIDNEQKVLNYLEHAANLNIYDVGFVSLMSVNTFCKKHQLDFESLNFDKQDTIVQNKIWRQEDACKCANYLYLPKQGSKVVKFYCRFACKHNSPKKQQLVFDGQYLRDGFNGAIIY